MIGVVPCSELEKKVERLAMRQNTTRCLPYLVAAGFCLCCATGWAVPKAAETEDDAVGFSDAVAAPRSAAGKPRVSPPLAPGARTAVARPSPGTVGKRAAVAGKPGHAGAKSGSAAGKPRAAAGKPSGATAGRVARPLAASAAQPVPQRAKGKGGSRKK